MTLGIVIVVVLFVLYTLGGLFPLYPASTKKPPTYKPPTYSAPPDSKGYAVLSTMPDLRVSEFAPDLDAVPSEWERTIIDVKKKVDLRKEALTEYKQVYENAILEIKTRRWKEGNPVTKKNPIDPDEMPPAPHDYGNSYNRVNFR